MPSRKKMHYPQESAASTAKKGIKGQTRMALVEIGSGEEGGLPLRAGIEISHHLLHLSGFILLVRHPDRRCLPSKAQNHAA